MKMNISVKTFKSPSSSGPLKSQIKMNAHKNSSSFTMKSIQRRSKRRIMPYYYSVKLITTTVFIFFTMLNYASSQSLFGGLCPEKCNCGLDERGRMEVICKQGRMTEVPILKMSPSTEVIKVIPPKKEPNHLAIGRFFKQFKKLEELHIVDSNIPSIGENSFWGVQSLRRLNLTSNNITHIVEVNFKGLVNLEVLSLRENNIETLVSASFQALPNLRQLDLSKNRVTKLVERLFLNLHMLEILDISSNWIRELNPDVFRDIWRLKELRCRECGLKTINPLLYALLTDIRVLDLGQNDFKYLNREEFGSLIHLKELYLDGNQISAITDDTFRSTRLKILSLGSNRILRIDRKAFENATIQHLDLSGNKFDVIDKDIIGVKEKHNFTRIDLSRNPKLQMRSLLIFLGENVQLKWLSLSGNQYEELPPKIFNYQKSLEFLNLSGNYFKELHSQHFNGLGYLKVLDLSYNRFKGLTSNLLNQFSKLYALEDIRLNGNPWSCDLCYISELLNWVRRSPMFRKGCNVQPGHNCLRCVTPSVFYERTVISLDENELDWCYNYPDHTDAIPASILADEPKLGLFIVCGILLLVLLIAAVLIIIHSRWHAAHYYTHEENRPEVDTPPIPPDYDHLAVNEGFDNLFFTENGNKNKMIATIEEISFVEPTTKIYSTNNLPELTSFKHHTNNSRPPSGSSPTFNNTRNNNCNLR